LGLLLNIGTLFLIISAKYNKLNSNQEKVYFYGRGKVVLIRVVIGKI
jgi:hypothetical protein